MFLKNKKIILGVSGSIAAYKSALLVRLLVKEGAEVKVIMTDAAKDFITPLTLSTLSKNPVLSVFSSSEDGTWNNHVELGLWADVIIIAPASANTLAKCAHGICDNLLIATYLSARCKVFFAPAMDLDMYKHFSTEDSINILQKNGNGIIQPEKGELASGLDGQGRLAEPENIVNELNAFFAFDNKLEGKKVLISAGPTQEDLDPVRYISNHSSGKMGFEIAYVFALAGAEVHLVTGPVAVKANTKVNVYKVRSANEMYIKMNELHSKADIVVFAAAVADYTPKSVSDIKIKKKDTEMYIDLMKTKDIAGLLGINKTSKQIHVGFALETNDELENAKSKLERKNFDMIVLNSLQDKGAGFRYDTNKITIIDNTGLTLPFELKSKQQVALDIKESVLNFMIKNNL
jgi:phosphopantothenoylcysteine decarboxylase / phosphopantothenate---cysteine ligase